MGAPGEIAAQVTKAQHQNGAARQGAHRAQPLPAAVFLVLGVFRQMPPNRQQSGQKPLGDAGSEGPGGVGEHRPLGQKARRAVAVGAGAVQLEPVQFFAPAQLAGFGQIAQNGLRALQQGGRHGILFDKVQLMPRRGGGKARFARLVQRQGDQYLHGFLPFAKKPGTCRAFLISFSRRSGIRCRSEGAECWPGASRSPARP